MSQSIITKCSVPDCFINSSIAGSFLHKIPTYEKYPILHGHWALACGVKRGTLEYTNKLNVCRRHFRNVDYFKGHLRAVAYPTINLGQKLVVSNNNLRVNEKYIKPGH